MNTPNTQTHHPNKHTSILYIHYTHNAIAPIPRQSPELKPIPHKSMIVGVAEVMMLQITTPSHTHLVIQIRVMPPVNALVRRDILANLNRLQNPEIDAICSHPTQVQEKENQKNQNDIAVLMLVWTLQMVT